MADEDSYSDINDVEFEDIINKDVLVLMGAESMPENVKTEIYNKMLRTIQNRTIARVTDILSDNGLEDWLQVAETEDPVKIEEFLQSKKIDMNQLMLQESIKYKAQMVALSRGIRDAKKKAGVPTTNNSGVN